MVSFAGLPTPAGSHTLCQIRPSFSTDSTICVSSVCNLEMGRFSSGLISIDTHFKVVFIWILTQLSRSVFDYCVCLIIAAECVCVSFFCPITAHGVTIGNLPNRVLDQ